MYRYALGSLATAGRVIGTKAAVIKNRPYCFGPTL